MLFIVSAFSVAPPPPPPPVFFSDPVPPPFFAAVAMLGQSAPCLRRRECNPPWRCLSHNPATVLSPDLSPKAGPANCLVPPSAPPAAAPEHQSNRKKREY